MKRTERNSAYLDQVAKLADGHPISTNGNRADRMLPGLPQSFDQIQAIQVFCPWIRVERTRTHLTLHLDKELRDICEAREARPELDGTNLRDWFKNLRAEIIRRRKENHDSKIKSNWQPDAVLKLKQHELLDYIESQLDLIVELV